MIWVGWRQQRTEVLIAAALLAVLAAVGVPVGVHMASVYADEQLGLCTGSVQSVPCTVSVAAFLSRFGGLNTLSVFSTLLPAVAALLFAAPFVLDLDGGAYRLFWTQSITRRRWIAAKLAFGLVGAVAVAAGLALLTTWFRAPLDHLGGRMSPNTYDAEGIVPAAYAVFVLGVAVALGALWRRAVPALLVAFVVYVAGRAFMDSWLRQRLLAPTTTTWAASGNGPDLRHALVLERFASDRSGNRLAAAFHPCGSASDGILSHTKTLCADPVGQGAHRYLTAIYQPASRFWALQGVEFALVAGLGALLVVAAAWWTHRRIA
jgi:hypothetical protein